MGETQLHQSLLFRIDRGIGQFNNDYYAVLGVPIDASPTSVRQNYLRIARRLHPDIYGLSPAEKEVATQFLAKSVNPAYNALMRPQEREAYQAIFRLLVRRLMMKERQVEIFAELAQRLLQSPSDWLYRQCLEEISTRQYANIEHILECSAQISELNLVYIFHKYAESSITKKQEQSGFSQGFGTNTGTVLICANRTIKLPQILSNLGRPAVPTSGNKSGAIKPTDQSSQSPKSPLPQLDYMALPPLGLVKPDPVDAETTILRNRREMMQLHQRFATTYMNQGQWLLALKELRSLIGLDPQNLAALTLMGVAHRQLSQWRLARETFEKARLIAPHDEFVNQQLKLLVNIIENIDNASDVTSLGGDTTVLQAEAAPQQNNFRDGAQRIEAPPAVPPKMQSQRKGNNTNHDAKLPAKNPPPSAGWWNNFWKNFNGK